MGALWKTSGLSNLLTSMSMTLAKPSPSTTFTRDFSFPLLFPGYLWWLSFQLWCGLELPEDLLDLKGLQPWLELFQGWEFCYPGCPYTCQQFLDRCPLPQCVQTGLEGMLNGICLISFRSIQARSKESVHQGMMIDLRCRSQLGLGDNLGYGFIQGEISRSGCLDDSGYEWMIRGWECIEKDHGSEIIWQL